MGQLIRILIILAGLWLVLHFVRRALARHRQRPELPRPTRMVACAVCGTHIPETEALRVGDNTYCSEAHRRAGEKT
jgi:uncharacterized protein